MHRQKNIYDLPDEDDWRGKTTEQVAVTVVLIKLYTNYSEHAIYVATDSGERQVDSRPKHWYIFNDYIKEQHFRLGYMCTRPTRPAPWLDGALHTSNT